MRHASLSSVVVLLLCALLGIPERAEARSKSPAKRFGFKAFPFQYSEGRAAHKQSVTGRKRRPMCAKRYGLCKGPDRHSRRACCKNPKDKCTAISRRLRICIPKRLKGREPEPLKADGETCGNDNECINACVALACTGDSNEGSCAGECGLLETVPFVPDQDEDYEAPPEVPACNEINASCSNGGGCCGDADCELLEGCTPGSPEEGCDSVCTERGPCEPDGTPCGEESNCCGVCDAKAECLASSPPDAPACPQVCSALPEAAPQIAAFSARAARCPGGARDAGELCWRRNGLRRRCRGGLRCVWGTRRITGFGVQWVGVCRNSRSRPIFNC